MTSSGGHPPGRHPQDPVARSGRVRHRGQGRRGDDRWAGRTALDCHDARGGGADGPRDRGRPRVLVVGRWTTGGWSPPRTIPCSHSAREGRSATTRHLRQRGAHEAAGSQRHHLEAGNIDRCRPRSCRCTRTRSSSGLAHPACTSNHSIAFERREECRAPGRAGQGPRGSAERLPRTARKAELGPRAARARIAPARRIVGGRRIAAEEELHAGLDRPGHPG